MRVIKCHHIQVPSGKVLPTATALEWHKPTGFEQWTSELPGTPLSNYKDTAHASNGFIDAACYAYSHHLPLVLNPWHVWIVILQNVSKYVNNHAEQVRHLIVAHEGKKEIHVPAGSIAMGIIRNFEAMSMDCKLDLGVDLSLNSRPEDRVARIVMQLAALDTVKSYFSFSITLGCGVPEYHIEGTHEDWQQLIDKVQQFAQLGPEVNDWVTQLVPVLQRINTSEDLEFWTRCCTLSRVGSGSQQNIDGWILAFYLYNGSGFMGWKEPTAESIRMKEELRKLKHLDETYFRRSLWQRWFGKSGNELRHEIRELQEKLRAFGSEVMTTDMNEVSLSRVPFTITDIDDTVYTVEVHSGLVGVTQDADTCAVRPLPGYVVWRKRAA